MPDLLRDRVVAAVGDLYDVEAEIGRGGMSVVYRAKDVRLRRTVAVKVLPPELAYREDVKRRFLREAETAAQLSHPNIVPIYAVDEREGLVFFVMSYIAGESLAARLYREPRPEFAFVRRVLREVADALAYAHARGVVHRDVKPDNILLDAESGRAMVTDFGIARAAEAESRLTVTGIAVGTPAYMSPEQAMGERELDGRSDVYSLGIVGYQMLAGQTPFQANNTPSMLMKQLGERPRPLRESRPEVPPALAFLVERALAKRPEDRWPDAGAMREALAGEGADPRAWEQPRDRAHKPGGLAGRPAWEHAAAVDRAARGGYGETRPPMGLPALPAPPALTAPPSRPEVPPPPAYPQWRPGMSYYDYREARRAWKEQWRAYRLAMRHAYGRIPASYDRLPIPERIAEFRRSFVRYVSVVGGLLVINVVTSPQFPWFVFPAVGMGMGMLWRFGSLWSSGVKLSEMFFGHPTESAAARRESAERSGAAAGPPTAAERVSDRVRAFRNRLKLFGVSALATMATGIVGGSLNIEALIPVFVFGCIVSGLSLLGLPIAAMRVRRAGISLRDAMRHDYEPPSAAFLPRVPGQSRAQLVAGEAAALVSADVLAGPHGESVRRAVEDRAAVADALARMPAADRELIPDVRPTVDSLVERVAALAQSLHRLDADVSPSAVSAIDQRIAAAEAEPDGAPDRERRLGLLRRQRATLDDLLGRRATLHAQLENATLLLQNMKLDLIKLRSAGVQSAVEEVTSATQEARALSREIGHVLQAAAEVRKL
ncbi:MAG: protein kinase domain-containing protein [Gemmatimonadaceae bacterium]